MTSSTSYRSRAVNVTAETGTSPLVVHCSDPRYIPHFQDFLRNGLELDRYALIGVPGSVHALALTQYLPKFSWAAWRWVRFIEDQIQPLRVILIGHHDCRWYLDARFRYHHGDTDEAQIADLGRVKAEMKERFLKWSVETWFARLDGDEAVFERLE